MKSVITIDCRILIKILSILTLLHFFNQVYSQTNFSAIAWKLAEVGNVQLKEFSLDDTRLTIGSSEDIVSIGASGLGFSTQEDHVYFAYKSSTCNSVITARIDELALSPSTPNTEAGLMVRQGLGMDMPYVAILKTGSGALSFSYRTAKGNDAISIPITRNSLPIYFRISRIDELFEVFTSYDGLNWVSAGKVSINMSVDVNYGMAISSANQAEMSRIQFSKVNMNCLLFSQTCTAPNARRVDSTTSYQTLLKWLGVDNARWYEYRYRKLDATPLPYGTWQEGTTMRDEVKIDSLVPNTNYVWQVRTVCKDGMPSTYNGYLFFVTPPAPSCQMPSGRMTANISTDSATINWNMMPGVETYDYRYREEGASSWIENFTSSTRVILKGLSINTRYEWQVRSNCGNGNLSDYSPPMAFATQLPCMMPMERFASNVSMRMAMLNWSQVNSAISYTFRYKPVVGGSWQTGNTPNMGMAISNLMPDTEYEWQVKTVCGEGFESAYSPSRMFMTLSDATVSCTVPSGPSTLTITTNRALINWDISSSATGYGFRYRSMGSDNWINGTTTGNSMQLGSLSMNTMYEWQVRSICGESEFSDYSPSQTFRTLAPCMMPPGRMTTDIAPDSAVISWEAPENVERYEFRYRMVDGTDWIEGSTNTMNTTLTGLSVNTEYEWQVRTICVSGMISPYSPPMVFMTPIPCMTPLEQFTANISTESALINWSNAGGAEAYEFRYRVSGTTSWLNGTTPNQQMRLSNLMEDTEYEWQVRTICDNNVVSMFSPSRIFTTSADTIPSCVMPTGRSNVAVTTNRALINWDVNSLAQSYEFRYRATGTTDWVRGLTPLNSMQLGGLSMNTEYEWQIRSICGEGSTSPFSPSTLFTTMAPCNMPMERLTTNIGLNQATLNWNDAEMVNAYEFRYRMVGTSEWIEGNTENTTTLISNLTMDTEYEWQVRTACNSGMFSAYSPAMRFSTQAPCTMPANRLSSDIRTETALINWDVSQVGAQYEFRYRATGSNNWVEGTTPNTTMLIENLLGNTEYEWQVRSICTNDLSSNYSPSEIFTTLLPCRMPGERFTSQIKKDSAFINWNQMAGAEGYEFRYREVGTTVWIMGSTLNTKMLIKDLKVETEYEWQVRTLCSSERTSDYSPIRVFITLADEPEVCNMPSGRTTLSITTTRALINWDLLSDTDQYEFRYRMVGSATWITGNTTTHSMQLGSLSPTTEYEWQVRTICGNGMMSDFSASVIFTTLTPCMMPSSRFTADITSESAVINWDEMGTAIRYEYRFRLVDSPVWGGGISVGTDAILNDLLAGNEYEWQVRTVCSTGMTSPYSPSMSFVTPMPCMMPANRLTMNITYESAQISWDENEAAMGYDYRYRPVGNTVWIEDNTLDTNIGLTNLSPETAYEWQVRTLCGDSISSNYAPSMEFITLESPIPICAIPTELMSSNITKYQATISWGLIPDALEYEYRYREVGDTTWLEQNDSRNAQTLANLELSTEYEWQVRTICDSGLISDYTLVEVFKTKSDCDLPPNRRTEAIGPSNAQIVWNPNNDRQIYEYRYRVVGSSTWIEGSTVNTNQALFNLIPGTTYEWQIRTECGLKGVSDYSPSIIFNTTGNGQQQVCSSPLSLNSSSIGIESVQLSWQGMGNTNSYTYRIRQVGTVSWSEFSTQNNSATPSQLLSNTIYEWQVRAMCANGPSAYSYSAVFTTLTDFSNNQGFQNLSTLAEERTQEVLSFQISPNPASDEVQVLFQLDTPTEGALMIYDLAGKVLINKTVSLANTSSRVRISTESLSNGVYIIRFHDNHSDITKRVMISR